MSFFFLIKKGGGVKIKIAPIQELPNTSPVVSPHPIFTKKKKQIKNITHVTYDFDRDQIHLISEIIHFFIS